MSAGWTYRPNNVKNGSKISISTPEYPMRLETPVVVHLAMQAKRNVAASLGQLFLQQK
jgi:hypothetical protein